MGNDITRLDIWLNEKMKNGPGQLRNNGQEERNANGRLQVQWFDDIVRFERSSWMCMLQFRNGALYKRSI